MAYSTRTDLETLYGRTNIKKWADLDNSEDEADIDVRIEWAIALAEAHVDSALRMIMTGVPFTDDIPLLVTQLASIKAGVLLYTSRGIADADADKSPLAMQEKEYDRIVGGLRNGTMRLPGQARSGPFIVTRGAELPET